eukprot:2418818-Rhodomonas_salina.1
MRGLGGEGRGQTWLGIKILGVGERDRHRHRHRQAHTETHRDTHQNDHTRYFNHTHKHRTSS